MSGCIQSRLPVAAALLAVLLSPWLQAADAEHGKAVFEAECSDCHSTTPGKQRKGPSLARVVGRTSASIPEYPYSTALRNSGLIWTLDQLDLYVTGPKKLVNSAKMKYDGLADANARADLIAFLGTLK